MEGERTARSEFLGFAPDNKAFALWQNILRVNRKLFGDSAENACLYHATEPGGTPDYFMFMDNYISEYGTMPQTTTAASLRNREWTRQLIEFRATTPTNSDRFSLLKEDDLHRMHAMFTPEELVQVKLLLQYDRGESDNSVRPVLQCWQ